MRGDGRSRRVVVVPDAYLNPAEGAPDRLSELAEAGWGVVALPQPGLAADVETAVLRGVVDQLAAFLDDSYEVALAEPDDPVTRRLADLLAADGRAIAASVTP